MTILVTGCAGFIGSHLVDRLTSRKVNVIGVDNFDDYYDPKFKKQNLKSALKKKNFKLYVGDILDFEFLENVFKKHKFDAVVHLAARAGVRPSVLAPILYADVNKIGTLNLLNFSVKYNVEKFIFASSSSVYGQSGLVPFTENDPCISIISPYGASKRAAEYFVETHSKLYGLKSVILRFFTVYGPRGRPDMAPALFTQSIIADKSIVQYGDGLTHRDYTYIDDIIAGVEKSLGLDLNFEIINLGNNDPVSLIEFIATIEEIVGKRAKGNKKPLHVGDVKKTWANISKANTLLNWQPKTRIKEGLKNYVEWLKKIH